MIDRQQIDELRGQQVHVVGAAGAEGVAMARWLASVGVVDLVLHDVSADQELRTSFRRSHVGHGRRRDELWREVQALPAQWRVGTDYLGGIDQAQHIFATQAWYLYDVNREAIEPLFAEGVPFHGLMDLYFGLAPARILAVTGSNGKSTTSRLAEHLLRHAGMTVWYAGNERRGVQVLDRLADMAPDHWLVLEVSNRHLRGLHLRDGAGPAIGIVTNVLPNHLDEHGHDLDTYAAVKQRLLDHQSPSSAAILNADNNITAAMAGAVPGDVYEFSRCGPVRRGAWLADGIVHFLLSDTEAEHIDYHAPGLPGVHNQENALAAMLAARIAGASAEAIERALPLFRGLRHRIQHVWSARGVDYYDDLNATTPQATIAALRALASSEPGKELILIAGGDDKGLPLDDLAAEIGLGVRRVVLMPGAGSDRIEAALKAATPREGPPVERFDDFETAVQDVVADARPGERVLLSPACPYFFRMNYVDGDAERGFKALLREITATSAAHEPTG